MKNEHDRTGMRTRMNHEQNDLWSYGGEVAPASAMNIPTRWDLTNPITRKYETSGRRKDKMRISILP